MTRYLVPGIAIIALVAILLVVNRSTYAFAEYMGGDFASGFLVGCAFCVGLYFIIQWLEPSRRDR